MSQWSSNMLFFTWFILIHAVNSRLEIFHVLWQKLFIQKIIKKISINKQKTSEWTTVLSLRLIVISAISGMIEFGIDRYLVSGMDSHTCEEFRCFSRVLIKQIDRTRRYFTHSYQEIIEWFACLLLPVFLSTISLWRKQILPKDGCRLFLFISKMFDGRISFSSSEYSLHTIASIVTSNDPRVTI